MSETTSPLSSAPTAIKENVIELSDDDEKPPNRPKSSKSIKSNGSHESHSKDGMSVLSNNYGEGAEKKKDFDNNSLKSSSSRRSSRCSESGSEKKNWLLIISKIVFGNIGLTILNLGFIVCGGFIFEHLEKTNEISQCQSSMTDYIEVLNKTTELLYEDYKKTEINEEKKKHLFYERLDIFRLSFQNGSFKGDLGELCELREPNWSFFGGALFAVTVITTIGYGHIAPATGWGRMVCIAYAFIGIPLMLVCLSGIGYLMARAYRWLYFNCCCCGCRRKKRNNNDDSINGGISRQGSRRSAKSNSRRGSQSSTGSLGESGEKRRGSSVSKCSTKSKKETSSSRGQGESDTKRRDSGLGGTPEGSAHESTSNMCQTNASTSENQRADNSKAPTKSRPTTSKSRPDTGKNDKEIAPEDEKNQSNTDPEDNGDGTKSRINQDGDLEISDQEDAGSRWSSIGSSDSEDEELTAEEVTIPLTITMFSICIYIIFGAILFHYTENWSVRDSAYFSFITVSTIGFGDMVPGLEDMNNPFAKAKLMATALYMLFGLALISMCFALMQDEMAAKVAWVMEKLGLNDDEDDLDEIIDSRLIDDDDNNDDNDDNSKETANNGSKTEMDGRKSKRQNRKTNRVA